MAKVKLDWDHVEFAAREVMGWVSFKRAVNLDEHPTLLSTQAVYVFRIRRPYAFAYPEGHSPVAYVGKGHAKQRITAHLRTWMPALARKFPDLRIRIMFCEPRIRRSDTACEDVEADLLQAFKKRYGALPLRNLVAPSGWGRHDYATTEIARALHPGSGKGYEWAIHPLPSSHFFRRP